MKNIEQDIAQLGTKVQELISKFKNDFNFNTIEQELTNFLNELLAPRLESALNEVLSDNNFLSVLKIIGGSKCLSFFGYRKVEVRILNGITIEVNSPYFYKRRKKDQKGRKRKKRCKGNNSCCHLGLALLGFISNCSGNLASEVTKMALLCPSFEVSTNILESRGIKIDVKTIRKICRDIGTIGLESRGKISMSTTEKLEGLTLVIGIDGGRLRERKTKRGRKKDGQKQQGYHTDWKEPKLFTIYLLDSEGQVVKSFAPFHDATMEGKEAVFEIMQEYLSHLPFKQLSKIVFCGDGAPWIWKRVEALIEKLLQETQVYQVLDYTHAKQALREILELLPKKCKNRDKIWAEWKDYLWKGHIDKLRSTISSQLKGTNKTKGLKKWTNYFKTNEKRMQYQHFKQVNVPCGSGCVESAIRRVINLRIKAPGSFWLKEMAECFLFLRSQLISGRWNIFFENIRKSLFYQINEPCKIKNIRTITPGLCII